MKVVIILSGGMDSTVLLYAYLREGHEVEALSFNYGQRHSKELFHAEEICKSLNVPHKVVDLSHIKNLLQGSSLTSDIPVPEGHYAEESMKATVVPNRNMIMLSIAAGYAISIKAKILAYAAHAGDHTIYPDCRPEFAEIMRAAFKRCDWHSLELETPFVQLKKSDLAKLGSDLGVPFEKTWSCYKGGEIHCGKCGTCVERIEAFKDAGVKDPTIYEV